MVACALALPVAGCGGDAGPRGASDEPRSPSSSSASPLASYTGAPSRWELLPAPPLSGRVQSLVAAVGNTLVVAGGWSAPCPRDSDCVPRDVPPYADGAAYDFESGQWRKIADAPVGLRLTVTAVLGDDIYAVSQCGSGPRCPAGRSLVRYRSAADEWDLLPGPGDEEADYGLIAIDDGVVAFSRSDEIAESPDYLFVDAGDRWVTLPNDPLSSVYDRIMVAYAGRLMLFATPRDETLNKVAAAYDPETALWEELAPSGTLGYQVWRAGSLLYLNPHFMSARGGIYDPATNRWSALPNLPYHDLAGVIGHDEASYEYAAGWVLDARTGDWLEIEPRPETSEFYYEVIATAPNQGLIVFGGEKWTNDEGQLVNDTWRWTPPPVSGSTR